MRRTGTSRRVVVSIVIVAVGIFGLPPLRAAAITQANEITYVYDELGRLEAAIDPAATNGIARYTYDAVGNLVSITRQSTAATSIIDFDPKRGSAGTPVTIYGADFDPLAANDAVTFNGTAATVVSASLSQIVATVPSGATTGPITVTSPGGSATSTASFTVGNPSAPTIGGFTPTIGTPGTAVTINGTNFDPATANDLVTFNGLRADVASASASAISAAVPSSATSGHIGVATPQGSALSSADFFVPPPPYTASQVGFTGRIAIGGTQTMTIGASGTIGMFVFDGTSGQRISLITSGATGFSGCCQTLKILNPDGSQLVSSYDYPNRFVDVATLPQTGTYTITFDPGSQTGSLTFTLYDVPPGPTATIVPGGAPVTLTTTTPGQDMKLTFSGSQGRRISLITSGASGISGCCQTLKILNPDGSQLVSSYDYPNRFVDVATLPQAGTYTITFDPGSQTGSLTFTLYDVPPDASGTITPGGAPVTLTTTAPGQDMKLTFSGTTGQRISLKTSGAAGISGCCQTLKILNPGGSQLVSSYDYPNRFVDVQTLPQTGTYTITFDPGSQTGSLTFTLYDVPPDAFSTISIGGAAVTLTTTTPGQNMKLTFDGTQGQLLTLTTSNDSGFGCCQYLKVFNPDGTQLLSNYGYGNRTVNLPALPQTGTYTITYDPDGAKVGSLTFQLSIQGGAAPQAIAGSPSSGSAGGARESRLAPTASAGDEPTTSPTRAPSATPEQPTPPVPPWAGQFHPPGPEEWVPAGTNLTGYWQTGRPPSPLTQLGPLPISYDTTSLEGLVLTLKGEPLQGVTLELGKQSVTTDETGRFVLSDIPAGHQVLEINGTTANRPGKTYGTFDYGVDLTKGQQNLLPFTIWMPLIDTAHAQSFSSPTTSEVTLSTPRIPGLEIKIPAGSVVKDGDGNVVTSLSITAVPIDRTPFPLPSFFETPVYFTVQPGGTYVFPDGARIIYPNYTHQPAGARVEFWNYDPDSKGWYIYGYGSVSADGKQIVPDPGVKVYEFSGAMINSGATPPPNGPKCSWWSTLFFGCHGGDPVDPQSGLFTSQSTDLYLPGTLPISLTRVYRQGDTDSRAFGIATNFTYGIFLWSANQYQEADLVMPDGARVHYVRISPGTGFTDAVFESTAVPGPYYKSTIVWTNQPRGWNLTLKDGTVFVFGENAPLQSIRDRYGNQITLTRTNGQSGDITRVASSDGRWISLTYDASHRITQAKDNIGRTVTYHYDANGRLDQMTDAGGGLTKYTWGSCAGTPVPATCNQMSTITDPRNVVVLTNAYDGNGRVQTQTLADGTSTYTFAYTLSGGVVTQTNITDPRGFVRKLTFNADGYTSGETLALGKPEAQTYSYDRQAGTGLLNSVTDPLGRKTSFTYDAMGNVTATTRLAGTSQAVTTSFTYDPAFNEFASITDPLGHTTTYSYDAKGNLTSATDAANRTSTFTYNGAGQLKTATDPFNHTWTCAYLAGDPVSITDPLGRTTTRFVDAAGRVGSATDPLGHRSRRTYDNLNELTKVTDPAGGETSFGYDPAGNLTSVTDAKGNATVYTYDAMDRLASRKDALLAAETYGYDGNGNLVSFTDRKGQVTAFTYDGLNRRTFAGFGKSGNNYSSQITYTYDSGNRITKLVDSRAGTLTRTFDDLDRLTSEIAPNSPRKGITYAYDVAGRRTSMTVGQGATPITYAYNDANQPTSIAQGTASVGFSYDGAGRPASVTLPDGVVQTYGYDQAGELTSITYTKGQTTLGDLAYGYDGAGRRTGVWGAFARTGLPSATTQNAIYNADNELTSWNGTAASYDADGNLTSFGSQTYTWNDRNQLASTSAGSSSFAYDALGRRLSKTISGTTTKYLYDGANIVQEQNTSNAATANLLTGLGIDQTFSRQVVGGATSSLLTDALGSTIALADANGAVQTSYTYDPFGAVTSSGAANTNSYQFTGRETDGSTGLDYFRARYYSPGFGRFISEDPLGLPGAPEAGHYGYAFDNPVGFTDHLGLDPGLGHWLDILIPILYIGAVICFATVACSLAVISAISWIPVIGSGLALAMLGATEAGSAAQTYVVRGGTNTLEQFEKQAVDEEGLLQQVSVNSAPGQSVEELARPLARYGQIGVTTLDEVEAAGGKVVADPLPGNPFHCLLSGITPEQACGLFTPTIPNPAR